MMGIGLSEAENLTYYEFTAIRWHWNERHRMDDDDVGPPDADYVSERARMLESRGIARMLH